MNHNATISPKPDAKSEPQVRCIRLVIWLREIIWAYRVKKCWRQAEGDYGQFLGNIGCYIAYKKLPRDILKRAGMSEPDNRWLVLGIDANN